MYVHCSLQNSIQITHLCDFEYWEIFHGLTVEQIKEREESFEYPPRLQITCEQIDNSKSLYSSFKVSKRSKDKEKPIAQFPLVKKVAGNHTHDCVVITEKVHIYIYILSICVMAIFFLVIVSLLYSLSHIL